MQTGDNSKFAFNFERLDWRKAVDFSDAVYRLTRNFPEEERFGLASQMRRAAVSIASNLAEGSSRSWRADFARFIEIAAGSVFEVVALAEIALRLGYLWNAPAAELGGSAA